MFPLPRWFLGEPLKTNRPQNTEKSEKKLEDLEDDVCLGNCRFFGRFHGEIRSLPGLRLVSRDSPRTCRASKPKRLGHHGRAMNDENPAVRQGTTVTAVWIKKNTKTWKINNIFMVMKPKDIWIGRIGYVPKNCFGLGNHRLASYLFRIANHPMFGFPRTLTLFSAPRVNPHALDIKKGIPGGTSRKKINRIPPITSPSSPIVHGAPAHTGSWSDTLWGGLSTWTKVSPIHAAIGSTQPMISLIAWLWKWNGCNFYPQVPSWCRSLGWLGGFGDQIRSPQWSLWGIRI